MKKFILAFLISTTAFAGNLQNRDFATPSQITGAGGSLSQLLNIDNIWDEINSQQLSVTIAGLVAASSSSLSNVLPNGDIFIGSAGNIATPRVMGLDATISNTGSVSLVNAADERHIDFLNGNDANPGTYLQPWKTVQHACTSLTGLATINNPFNIQISGGNNDSDAAPITCPPNLNFIAQEPTQISQALSIVGGATNDNISFTNIIFVGSMSWIRNDATAIGAQFNQSQFFSGPTLKQQGSGSLSATFYNSVTVNMDLLAPKVGSFFNNHTFLGTSTFEDTDNSAYFIIQGGYNSGAITLNGGATYYFSGMQTDVPFGASLTAINTAKGTPLIQSDSGSVPENIFGTFSLNLISHSNHESYNPATPSNWSPVPATVSQALDILAARTSGSGTVSSVGLSLPSIFQVSGSPVTSAGTLSATLSLQASGTFFAGPALGSAASPSFRTIASDDLNGVSWNILGNTGTNPATNFLGTIDSQDLVFKTNNIESGRFLNATKALVVGSQSNIQLGTSDPFARNQIWNKNTNSILRLGSWEEDGDPTSSTSEGIVVYGDSLTGQPISNTNGSYARVKPNRFGLFTIDSTLPAYNAGAYYFRIDDTQMFYADNSDVNTFSVQRTSGDTYIAGILSLDKELNQKQISTPANPAAGRDKLYFKNDDKLYGLNSAGTETLIGPSPNNGTVTSVALSLPSIFNVSGSPVTTAGTLNATLSLQSANTVFSGPTAGGAASPSFRALVTADIPDLSGTYLPLTGGTMSGQIDMGTHSIVNLATPSNPLDAANKAYVDAATSSSGLNGTLVGLIEISSCSAGFSTGSAGYANFGAGAGCSYATTGLGVSAPATNVPGIQFSSLPAGEYSVEFEGAIQSASGGSYAQFRFSDGTNNTRENSTCGPSGTFCPGIKHSINYSSPQTNLTLQLQGLTVGGGSAFAYCQSGTLSCTIRVYRMGN